MASALIARFIPGDERAEHGPGLGGRQEPARFRWSRKRLRNAISS
jgi:hypothetical protein